MERPEPGWYSDPEQPGQVRYYDGGDWTDDVRDVAPGETPAEAPVAEKPTNRAMLLLVGVVLMVVVLAGSMFLGTLADGDGETGIDDDVLADPEADEPADDPADAPDAEFDDEPGDDPADAPSEDDEAATDPDAGPDDAGDDEAGPQTPTSGEGYDAPFEMTIDPAASYLATITTSEGDIVLELDAAGAPATTNNLVNLARDGFYDGVIFHRVIEGFMIQGGDPTGTGSGGPGYRFDDELETAEALVESEGGYPRGTLAMANAGPNTNGSQFFIVHAELVQLPPDYAVFGRVVEGLDVVDAIATTPTGPGDRPTTDITIATIDITEE